MKTLLIIICGLGLTLSASAQRVVHVAPHYVRPRVSVGLGFGAYPYYSPWGWYAPYYAYPPAYGYHRPTKLDLQIQDIQNDYKDRIWSARHDESISRHDRRAKVQELKHERDEAIIQAKRDYYKR